MKYGVSNWAAELDDTRLRVELREKPSWDTKRVGLITSYAQLRRLNGEPRRRLEEQRRNSKS